MKRPRLIVHGGAWNIPDKYVEAHLRGVEKAVADIYPQLEQGLSALDAVECAVNIMEADPTFDAGRGAFLNAIGEIELDAIIADGAMLTFGAVAAVQNLLHPVSLARKVMTETEHRLLVGSGARQFARQMGFHELPPEDLLTDREKAFFEQIKNDPHFHTAIPFDQAPMGTVGAVALDNNGNLAAATSTGGTPRKLPGRVGDTPVYGAGAYADNHCGAASATGWGEAILSALLSLRVCEAFGRLAPERAAAEAVALLKQRYNGLGGVVAINPEGEYAFAHNTPRMAVAFAEKDGNVKRFIEIVGRK